MASGTPYLAAPPALPPGGEWFAGAGLGIFVHWDHASEQGIEISWPLVGRSIIPGVADVEDEVTVEQYQSSADRFDPVDWDASAIARRAREAGASYVIFTARHHAGYSMFHTKHSDFGIQTSAFGRDVTRELLDAVRAEGVRVGLYYSLPDWNHPDYPAMTMADRPYKKENWPEAGDPAFDGFPVREEVFRRSSPLEWGRYLDYVRGQLTELLTDYGTIDVLWFDGDWERSAQEWDAAGLRAMIKQLQPRVLINDRLPGQGDYSTPEQRFPLRAPDGPWELGRTIGEMWGWRPDDTKVKSARSLVAALCEVTGRGGNLLLNVSPTGSGTLPEVQIDRLEAIAEWMSVHRESVVGTRPAVGVDFAGPVTARPGRVYLHLLARPVEQVIVRGLPVRRVTRVHVLQTGADLPFEITSAQHDFRVPRNPDALGELVIDAPEPTGALVDVIAIDIA